MRHYETTYILRPGLGEEQFSEIVDRSNAIITDDQGVIIDLDRWGLRRLAYEINKEIQGYYVHVNYAGTPAAVAELERIFRIDDRVLRYLTIKLSDSINDAGIEAEKERIAKQAAAMAAAAENPDEDSDEDDGQKEELNVD